MHAKDNTLKAKYKLFDLSCNRIPWLHVFSNDLTIGNQRVISKIAREMVYENKNSKIAHVCI